MTRAIYKYSLDVMSEQIVTADTEWKPLAVGEQNGILMLWADVDPKGPTREHKVSIRGTGHNTGDECGPHFGTVQQGGFVWHVYVEKAQEHE